MNDRNFEKLILPLIDDDAKRLGRLPLPDLFRAVAVRIESAPRFNYPGLSEEKRHLRAVVSSLCGSLLEAEACKR